MCSKSLCTLINLVVIIGYVLAECGPRLKYAWGDAMQGTDCPGPDGTAYPRHLVNRALKTGPWSQTSRQGRGVRTVDPTVMRRALLDAHESFFDGTPRTTTSSRNGDSCGGSRLCRTRFNTTAPMYGVSLTSGQPVTIVQKFPDLLQQVIFEVCESSECSVVRGSCVQTYMPYLFLVLPLGPVTLTGQDYVLVESGCVCRQDPM
ncbi:hypothetical protein K1T71_004669 [Dendrolimus kikuchii]|uniref:Uncharacterized protein n=1 Tax=Dendrolimus kikuchii TaxID=765133 RepID=A0ACC1D831_9NEOP|nr:hypothetical protein K1T71_004669 [Dendrolimus kikuchii]